VPRAEIAFAYRLPHSGRRLSDHRRPHGALHRQRKPAERGGRVSRRYRSSPTINPTRPLCPRLRPRRP